MYREILLYKLYSLVFESAGTCGFYRMEIDDKYTYKTSNLLIIKMDSHFHSCSAKFYLKFKTMSVNESLIKINLYIYTQDKINYI